MPSNTGVAGVALSVTVYSTVTPLMLFVTGPVALVGTFIFTLA